MKQRWYSDYVLAAMLLVFASMLGYYGITHWSKTDYGANYAFIGVLVGVLTFTLVFGQVRLAERQIAISEEQKTIAATELQIVKDQGKILEHQEREMNRKARLYLWALRYQITPGASSASNGMTLCLGNIGNRSASEAVVVVLLPLNYPGFQARSIFPIIRSVEGTTEYEGATYLRAEIDVAGILQENYTVVFPFMFMNASPPQMPSGLDILYRLVYADDITPGPYNYLPITTDEAAARDAARIN